MKQKMSALLICSVYPICFLLILLLENSKIQKRAFDKGELVGIKKYDGQIEIRVPGSMCTWIIDKEGDGTPEYTHCAFGAPRRGFISRNRDITIEEKKIFNEGFRKIAN